LDCQYGTVMSVHTARNDLGKGAFHTCAAVCRHFAHTSMSVTLCDPRRCQPTDARTQGQGPPGVAQHTANPPTPPTRREWLSVHDDTLEWRPNTQYTSRCAEVCARLPAQATRAGMAIAGNGWRGNIVRREGRRPTNCGSSAGPECGLWVF